MPKLSLKDIKKLPQQSIAVLGIIPSRKLKGKVKDDRHR